METKFKVGDTIIRKRMPQYAGLPRPILVIESIDDKYYRFEGGSISDIRHQNHFELYNPSNGFLSKLRSLIEKCGFNKSAKKHNGKD